MVTMTTEGVEDLLQGLIGMQRQIPYAVANGLNKTAGRIREATLSRMEAAFHNPTPFVMNSLQFTPALAPTSTTKYRHTSGAVRFGGDMPGVSGWSRISPRSTPQLQATVWFKDPPKLGDKKHFLLPQVEGGTRPIKAFEKGISHKSFVMPSKGTTLDPYGNLGRGRITKLLSIAGGFHEVGFTMNTKSKSKKAMYFRVLKQRGKLAPGVYERVMGDEEAGRTGRFLIASALVKKERMKGGMKDLRSRTKAMYPRGVKQMVFFAPKKPKYTMRLDFYGIGQKVVDAHLRDDMGTSIQAEIEREMAYRSRHGAK
ncbi:MAG: hypothetical protein A2075_09240 [Geobacteraceae bacterium GWC2_58_44]|nr:MAG: hypothetical protein A2075_09240 [Geobacteraceae bacterium GWC2_58_44]HBG07697.1 hypothetical protein [Geobacter sp.]